MSIQCVLIVIVPLILVYKFFPEFFTQVFDRLIGFILNSRLGHSGGEKSENEINWSTLYIVFIITFVITVICCVLLKRNKTGLYLLYTWIVTCLIVEVVLTVYISYYSDDIKISTVHWLEESFDNYNKSESRIIRIIWDDVQTLLKCCGPNGLGSWYQHKEYLLKTYNSELPNSCCETQVPCLKGKYYKMQAYKAQCNEKLDIYFEENVKLVTWTFEGLAIVKVVAVILSNFYTAQLERVFQISSAKLKYKINKTWSSEKFWSPNEVPLEKI